MKNTPIEFRPIAYRRPIELHSLTQRKVTIFFKHIDNLNTIAWLRGHALLLVSASLLLYQPFFLLFLANKGYSIANRICGAAMPCPCTSNYEKSGYLRPLQRLFSLNVRSE